MLISFYRIKASLLKARPLILMLPLCLFTLICLQLAFAQQPIIKFDRLTTEKTLTVKGLSQNSIYCLLQDSQGFIWIGTWDGLNRYDGYDFIIYNTENGLSNPTVNALCEDEKKNIWIGTDNGLNHLDRKSGNILQFHNEPGNTNSISNNAVNHLYQDKKGFIWISTAYGLNCLDKAKMIYKFYNFFERNADSTMSNFISRVIEDREGRLWIGTHSGVHCFYPEQQSFKDYKMVTDPADPEFIRSNYIEDLVCDENGNIYAATLNGIFIIYPDKGIIHHLEIDGKNGRTLSGNQVNSLLTDSKGLVWIGTNNGLDLFNPALNTINHFKSGGSTTSISNDDIRSIYQDQAGTIWIGTYKGLNKVDQSPSRFTHFQNDPQDPNSLSDNIVYAILEDDKGLTWIATYGGINIFDRKNDLFSFIRHDPDNPESLSSNKTRTLALDSTGNIWVGTESNGMNRIDKHTGKISRFSHIPDNKNSLSEDNILCTTVDRKGRVWIGTASGGLTIIDPKNGNYQFLGKNAESNIILSDNRIWAVYEDRDGNFWVGTNEGLNRISADLRSVKYYRNNPASPNSISSNRVFSIYEDNSGIFWIGTMGEGLNRFDPVREQFKVYTERNGLPNNVVYTTLDDKAGNLWLSTNWGLSKFNKVNEIFVNYDTKDGVQGNEFNAGAYFQNRHGEMYFGGMNGFNVFYPAEITLNRVPPRMVFTGLRILNDLVDTDIENGEIIRLSYMENFFSIEFSGLDYTNPSKNLYRYKLDKYDEGWIFANAGQRRAEYRKVDPGSYHFLVTGSNNDGIWNPDGISLTIIISPPWWKTWVFRLLLILILVTLLWSFIILRIKTIKRKHEVDKKMLFIEKQVFELEQKALRLQMNPHFIFNSLNAIQNFVLINDTDKAVNYLAKFSHLMRMILANSTASFITLKDELKALTYYMDLEKLRFDNKFDYLISRDPSIDEEFVEIPPMLFQPYVENAIIHGFVNSPDPGLLDISLKRMSPGTLQCVIQDNGIGREKAIEIREKSGIKRQPRGMSITQERIEIFNKQSRQNFSVRIIDLKDAQGVPTGTRVEFTIQYKEI
jgi:ligand-binding sensor domain-containing protein